MEKAQTASSVGEHKQDLNKACKWMGGGLMVTMAELAARSVHDQKVVGLNLAGYKSDLTLI